MGTDYWLVDFEGKNALDVDRWYDLHMQPEYADLFIDDPLAEEQATVTLDILARAAASKKRGMWLAAASAAWLVQVAQGRRVVLRTHDNDDEWVDWRRAAHHPAPGWTLYSCFAAVPPPVVIWRPPEAAPFLARLRG